MSADQRWQPSTGLAPAAFDVVLRRFPLVARPRIACPPIDVRIGEIVDLAASGTCGADAESRIALAYNKAALIASDCNLPGLARALCWRHHDLYRDIHPWTARHALEPLVNLARLDIRHGRTDDAVELLNQLWQAVRTGHTTVIDGRRFSPPGLTRGSDDHQSICHWLWAAVVSEGLRGLAAAGRWSEALAHTHQHRGLGQRLLDGRQIAVLAHTVTGDQHTATRLINESDIHEPWERTVAACLHVINKQHTFHLATAMVDHYLTVEFDQDRAVFTTRLGLTVIDLAGGPEHPNAARAAERVTALATTTGDAYVARELLQHPVSRLLPRGVQEALLAVLNAAALGGGADHTSIETRLLTALGHTSPGVAVLLNVIRS